MTKLLKLISIFSICFFLTTNNAFAYQEQENQKTLLKGVISEDYSKPSTGIGVIGLRFIHQTGYPTYIKEVYPNSPATRTGLKENDLIFSADGIKTDNLTPEGIYQLLSGTPGTPITLVISRGTNMFSVELIREDLANFSDTVQNRYLSGPISVPFDIRKLFAFE